MYRIIKETMLPISYGTQSEPIVEIARFDDPQDAMDYMDTIECPKVRKTWEPVGEEGYNDGVNVFKRFKSYYFENIYNGDIMEIKYSIKWLK